MFVHRMPRWSHRGVLVVLLLMMLAPVLPGSIVVRAATYTVTTTADSGGGSLRDAINQVNANAFNAINFSIGSGAQTINLGSALPGIFSPVTIDGTTQPGYSGTPLIEIHGLNGARCLTIAGGNSTVKGLAITGCGGAGAGIGIYLLNAGGDTVQGNYVGMNSSGARGLGNDVGIYFDQISNNTVGGTSAAARNVISGNAGNGIVFSTSSSNIVQGNYVGITPNGSGLLGNFTGIFISSGPGHAANNNTVGGTGPGMGNVIGGNNNAGIAIDGAGGSATGNVVQGNMVGLNPAGSAAIGNHFGIFISAASNNTIGGTAPGARNVIAANVNVPGVGADASGDGISIDGTNGAATGNVVQGNYIGTDAGGTVAFANIEGVYVKSASNNTIGGTTAAARNVISGNSLNGITFDGSTGTASSNVALGNLIGTNAAGTAALPNDQGVYIAAADGNTVGGSAPGAANIISGNTGNGVAIDARRSTDLSVASAQFNLVQGNFIGTDPGGTVARPNRNGIYVIGGRNNTVTGNIVSGNSGNGITLDGTISGTAGNSVQGNFVGTNAAGNAALGNDYGVYLSAADHNTIGGNGAGQRNVISANRSAGVLITGINGTNNTVAGNYIGTDASGVSAIGGGGSGVNLFGANSNTIGGFDAASGNIIANIAGDGVVINAASTTANSDSVLSNRIFANTGISIHLANGANRGQAAPVITAATFAGGSPPQATISGTLHGTPTTLYRLEFFGNASAVSQGKLFYGPVVTGATNGSGDLTFTTTITYDFSARFITATATSSATGDTSPFSGAVGVPSPPPTVGSIAPTGGPTTGGTSATITGTNFFAGATVTFGGTAAPSVTVVNTTTIVAITPAHGTGVVDVVVRNSDGASATLRSSFTYVDPEPMPRPHPPTDPNRPVVEPTVRPHPPTDPKPPRPVPTPRR